MSVLDLTPFNTIISRLETVANRLESVTGGQASGAPASAATPASAAVADDPAIAVAFDVWVKASVEPVIGLAAETGVEDIKEGMAQFQTSCTMLRDVLVASTRCKKPADTDWQKILAPVMELGQKAQKACDNRSDYFQNRKATSEAINIVMLVVNPSPPAHVQNVLESMDFHAMKVMQKKNEKETAWIKGLKAALKEGLQDWCKENCKLGLTWNVSGEEPMSYFGQNPVGSGGSGAAPSAPAAPAKGKGKGKAPPPPKGGFAAPPKDAGAAPAEPAGMAAVFGDIANFSTSNLKKVTADMKSKNLPKQDPVVPKAKATASAPATRRGEPVKGPKGEPKMECVGSGAGNWMVENFEGVQDLKMEDASMQQSVYILNCKNITLQVTTKVKSIAIDSCAKVNVICADVLSVVELVNTDNCKVQTVGKTKSFAIDKCNGVNIFLNKDSLDAEITTSKSSEMNLTIPDEAGDEGDTIEMPIPEQFVTTVAGPKKLKTEVSSLYS